MEEKNNSRENLEKGKNNKTLIIVLVVLGIILLIGIVFCVINRNTDSNKNNNDNNKDNDVVDKDKDKIGEDIKDNDDVNEDEKSVSKIISNIQNGKKYTKQELIDLGFDDYTIDMNSNLSDKSQKPSEIENDDINNNTKSGYTTLNLSNDKLFVNSLDENYNVVSTTTIDNIDKVKIHNPHGRCISYLFNVYLISKDNELYYGKIIKEVKDFKSSLTKVSNRYKYTDVFTWANYSTTCGASYTYIGKTIDGEYKILNGEYDLKNNTYKILNDNVVITNDRNIYIKDELQNVKCKFVGSTNFIVSESDYIITDDDYLYNDKFEKEKKIVSILSGVSDINENSKVETYITIDENGNNDVVYGNWINN